MVLILISAGCTQTNKGDNSKWDELKKKIATIGNNSGSAENLSNSMKDITNVEKCSDGTLYDQCSKIQPKYCNNGTLTDNAILCKCPSGYKQFWQYSSTCIEKDILDTYNEKSEDATDALNLGSQKFNEAQMALDAKSYQYSITLISEAKVYFTTAKTNFKKACDIAKEYSELFCQSGMEKTINDCLIPALDAVTKQIYITEDLSTECNSFTGCPSNLVDRCDKLDAEFKALNAKCSPSLSQGSLCNDIRAVTK